MNRRERRSTGRKSKQPSPASGAPTAVTLCEAGFVHMKTGRHLDAQLCCQQALAIDPGYADAQHLMGLLALEAGQNDHALEWFARAISLKPNADYVSSLGTALQRLGRLEEAVNAFDKAVQLKPDDAEGWNRLANVLRKLERLDMALLAYRHVLKLSPRQGDAAYHCGFILRKLRRLEEALAYFNLCDEIHPNHAMVLELRGLVLYDLNRFEEALADHQRLHALKPTSPEVCNNIGSSLRALRLEEEALTWFDKAVALRPGFVVALVNKALALIQLRRLDEAVATFHLVMTMDPDNVEAKFNLSLIDLLRGNFEAGWAGREVRWKGRMRTASYPHFSEPMWLGEADVEGKTVLVYEDEGLGDTIQFVRYLPMLAARGAHVVLVVKDPLCPLLSGLQGVAQCLPRSLQLLPAFDLHCPVCSLPLAFKTRLDTIPSKVPYLPAPSPARLQTWEDRLGPRRKPRIGLVWSGNPKPDRHRSIPLRMVLALLDVDATFVSLQKDVKADDKTMLEQTGIIELSSHLTDFAETAALACCLDLVITIDTSVAHLAGALGRPTWTLLPYAADHRWLLDRDDSPWYPTMRLFRQSKSRDWEEVLDRVRRELQRHPSR